MLKDTYIAEFTKDQPDLLKIELEAIKEVSDHTDYSLISKNIALVVGDPVCYTESAFLRYLGKVLWYGKDLKEVRDIGLPQGRFFVRTNERGRNNPEIERSLGEKLGGEGRISFESPDFVVRAYNLDKWYITVPVSEGHRKEMEKRTAPMRPFFSPVSLHPYIARFMINLTQTEPKETVLDPFCGTGGILIEAAMMGRKVLGADASLSMVAGARMNLRYFGIEPKSVVHSTFEDLKLDEKVDSIATDFPYGRSSPFFQHSATFLQDALDKFYQLLKDGGICVAITNMGDLKMEGRNHFKIINKMEIRRHKSLTRHIFVLKKGES